MVKPKKASSKKQKTGSIDFKKIKRKIGRKLPPPKNSTDTRIKSKAIVLPEQSMATDRAGLAVSNKGLTLKELLQQSSHHNARTRKFALVGIKDLLEKNPLELKLHKIVTIEKLRERICDTDKVVRDTLFHLLKTVIFPDSTEDVSIISLMMGYVFNAMTHLAIDIRLAAFNFFDLIVTSYPSSFFLYAEKVVDNYKDILQNNQIYLVDRSKLKMAIGGLFRCMGLLGSNNDKGDKSHEEKINARRAMHAFEFEVPTTHTSVFSISDKLEELMPVLVYCFQELAPVNRVAPVDDTLSFDCMVSLLQCINLAVCYIAAEVDKSKAYLWGHGATISSNPSRVESAVSVLKKLWHLFPFGSHEQSTEKEDQRYFVLNVKVTEIYLHVMDNMNEVDFMLDKFLEFLENSLYGQSSSRRTNLRHQDRHLISVIPLLPRVVAHVSGYWKIRLLQAFTRIFQDCKAESRLNLACFSAMKEMLLSEQQNMISMESCGHEMLDYQACWLKKLPPSLLNAGDKNPSLSKVILKLMLRIGQCSSQNSHIDFEYNNLQLMLGEFYSTVDDAGKIILGPFTKLPTDCQELAICCLYYFSSLTSDLMQSLTYCCLCPELERLTLMRMFGVLQSAYRAGHLQIADYLGFLVTVVARFNGDPDNHIFRKEGHQMPNQSTFKAILVAVLSCLCEMGDNVLLMKLLQKSILNEMNLKPSIENMYGLLKLIAVLDSRPSRLPQETIIALSHFMSTYLINIASKLPDIADGSVRVSSSKLLKYYFKPCLFLFHGSSLLMNRVLLILASFLELKSPSSLDCGTCMLDVPKKVNAISLIITTMFEDMKTTHKVYSSKEAIIDILRSISNLLCSNSISLTTEEKLRIKHASDIVKTEAYQSGCLESADIEGT